MNWKACLKRNVYRTQAKAAQVPTAVLKTVTASAMAAEFLTALPKSLCVNSALYQRSEKPSNGIEK